MAVRSMTGFARVRKLLDHGEMVISLKSVNHRGLDLHFHMPPEFDASENTIRSIVKKHVSRGHIQIHLTFAPQRENHSSLNHQLLSSWLAAFRDASQKFDLSSQPDLNVAFQIPGMFHSEVPFEIGPEFDKPLAAAIEEGLKTLNEFREKEGAAIAVEMRQRSEAIGELVTRMEKIRSKATAAFQKRLKERLSDLLRGAGIEPQRLAQEAALLADRSDISEELIRLKTHAAQLEELLDNGGETGKKLDFLLQEMNREANTVLSKTGGLGELGLTITDLALAAKAEIDKIREQSLNIE